MDRLRLYVQDKRIVIVSAVVVGILLGVLLLFLLSPAKQRQTIQSASGIIISTAPAASRTPSPVPTIQMTGWHVYDSQVVTLKYPPEWTLTSTPAEEGGTTLTLVPTDIKGDATYPRLTMQYFSSSNSAFLTSGRRLYDRLHFQESTLDVGGLQFVRLQGTFPKHTPGGPGDVSSMQLTVMGAATQARSYLIEYTYGGDNVNSEYESLFQSMLSLMRFH